MVDNLRAKGAVFVEELDEIPDTKAPVVFSAHGVPKTVPEEAQRRNFFSLDATCPLVTKVHREAAIHYKRGREILLIGHSHHPEVVGTLGQLPDGAVHADRDRGGCRGLSAQGPRQSRLCDPDHAVDRRHRGHRRRAAAAVSRTFPGRTRKTSATPPPTARRRSRRWRRSVDAMIVVGAPNSSNSQRLREVAEREGCPRGGAGAARLRYRLDAVRRHRQRSASTAGASAPGSDRRGDHGGLRGAL
ncbi:MAG: 4-hydroxy-3-methylbut-2-enyl diphosphate reductase [Rhodopseudomonas palustris]|nr:4-hydroxy-3-methylbut-2-enyl diphosphate reductase [Rhodopseudomonas palustris]